MNDKTIKVGIGVVREKKKGGRKRERGRRPNKS